MNFEMPKLVTPENPMKEIREMHHQNLKGTQATLDRLDTLIGLQEKQNSLLLALLTLQEKKG